MPPASDGRGFSLSIQEVMFCCAVPVAVDDLASMLRLACNSASLRAKTRETILQGFDPRKNSTQYFEVYRELGYRF
ncbi:hypothetical protein HOC87_05990 [Candidatus Bathyarchaeota archaeon]|nr:hypothetical protein [Candidatus Bathyarchaeota archaeon]